ncbi:hypothetical protein F4780DRAFT_148966 [Xylariomycetidae sp. FL0641]|nr:hypothetical protein F4780DRAFT_148966 [Xylariomycetidae sp. FL0641]
MVIERPACSVLLTGLGLAYACVQMNTRTEDGESETRKTRGRKRCGAYDPCTAHGTRSERGWVMRRRRCRTRGARTDAAPVERQTHAHGMNAELILRTLCLAGLDYLVVLDSQRPYRLQHQIKPRLVGRVRTPIGVTYKGVGGWGWPGGSSSRSYLYDPCVTDRQHANISQCGHCSQCGPRSPRGLCIWLPFVATARIRR